MDLSQLNLGALTPIQFFAVATIFAVADWAWGVIQAIRPPNVFAWAAVTNVLETHVLKAIVPIYILALAGQTLGGVGGSGFYALAATLLLAYIGKTVASLIGTTQVANAMAAENTAPPTLTSDPVPDDAP